MKHNYANILWVQKQRGSHLVKNAIMCFSVFFLMLFSSLSVVGQNGVTISSTSSNPTDQNPIPVEIKFDQPVNFFEQSDISLVNGSLLDFFIKTPNYDFIDFWNLDNINVSPIIDLFFGRLQGKINKIVVSIDVNSNGEVFVLTFGNGIRKFDQAGIELSFPVGGNKFDSPLDLAINSKDEIYVADNGGKYIYVFDSSGSEITGKRLGSGSPGCGKNEFGGPIGIEFDKNDNVYIADIYDGNASLGEGCDPYSVRVYYYDGTSPNYKYFTSTGTNKLDNPYRLTIDKNGLLYVADLGGQNGRVQIFNTKNNFQFVEDIKFPEDNIGSPGSIAVDDYGFIYIADFGNEVNITQFLNAGNDPFALLDAFDPIKNGIVNEVFSVKIFDSNRNFRFRIINEIDLPIDLAFNECGKLYVNNANLTGSTTNFTLDFDLEFYNRLPDTFTANLTITEECIPAKLNIPSAIAVNFECVDNTSSNNFERIWDKTNPTKEFCPEDQTKVLTNGTYNLEDFRNLVNFSDNCDDDLTLTQNPTVGASITQTTTVSITAKDDAGNVSEACTFQVIIEDQTDTEPPVITCPTNITQNVDPGECGAVVAFANATATDNSGDTPTITRIDNSGLNSGDFFPIGETTITFRATDGAGLTDECSFTITVVDNEKPTISCTSDISEAVAFGESGKVITYSAPTFDDNCSGSSITQTDGLASGSEFPVGTTTNIFEVTDASENTFTCSFNVTITENTDTEPPVITCPTNITQNVDPGECGAVVAFANATAIDNSGDTPTITRIDNSGLNPGDFFPVGETTITFRATDGAGLTDECSFTITVVDNEKPTISCSSNISETVAFGESGKVITYSAPTFGDNCSGSSITQTDGLASGSEFPVGTTTNTFEVTDASDNTFTCSFNVTITENTDTEPPVISCPTNITQNVDPGECGAVLAFANATATDNSGDTPTINRIDNSGLNPGDFFPVGETTITFRATDGAGLTDECSFTITVVDNEKPTISCPSNISEAVAFGESGKVITYSAPTFEDNCSGSSITQIDGLASGSEFPVGTTTNIFEITDASENTFTCSFNVTITEGDEPQSPSFTCPDPNETTVLTLDENCDYVVPDYSDKITDFENFENSAFFIQTNSRNGNSLSINIEVYDGEGGDFVGECNFTVDLRDTIPPKITCPSEILVEYTADKTYTVPNFSSLYSSSDNCSTTLSYFQTPAVGTVITEDMGATFRVGDENNNFITCNFNIKFINSADLQITNCLGNQTFEVGNVCEFTVPDYASTITANDPDAVITQSIPAGTVINNALPITITATLDGQTATCEFQLIPKDSINPVVICPGDQNEIFNPSNGFSLPNYALQAQASDNCEVAKIEQIPDVGTVIFEDMEVTIRIEDATGNSATCTFNVNLTEENTANTPPVVINDTYSIAQDMTLSISAPGVLGNDSDAEGDELTAVIQSSTPNGDLVFNSDGSFSYTPNSGFTGEDTFTYVVNDGFVDSAVATVRITVIATTDNTVICKESIILELDENGIANLNAAELFTARPEDLQFSVSQEVFTCDDLGENTATLSYSNSEVQGSCEVTIIVKDVSAPILNVKDISIALNEFGSITITPEMLDNGSTDNCENLTFSLSKLTFGCKDLGENTVTFTATDSSENSSSTTAIVTITGNCEIGPEEGVEYIFIYPNPTSGPFQFATPVGVTIQRVEAFDFRGRMIMFKEYSEIDLQYNMDLSGVQNAVYILKLFTSEGIDIKRVIIN